MKRAEFAIAGALALLIGASTLWESGYMPGTICRDANGFIHGTGRWLYHYDSGPLMLEEHYLSGKLRYSKWFRPNGSLVAETHWRHGDGVGYYLRQDGTIRVKMEHRNGLAHGQATYFKEDGETIDHFAEYRDGRKIEN